MIYDKNNIKQRWLKFICAKTAEERKTVAKGDELLMKFDNWCEEYVNDEQTKKIFGECIKGINYVMLDETNIDSLISNIETPAFGYENKLIIDIDLEDKSKSSDDMS